MYSATRNRNATAADVLRCQALVAQLRRVTRGCDDDVLWTATNGTRTYGEGGVCSTDFGHIDAAFLDRLRFETFFFSGWRLENLFLEVPYPSWTDGFAEYFPDAGAAGWPVIAFRQYSAGLPPQYICKAPLVAGESGFDVDGYCVNPDIVSYQERMAALAAAGFLDALGDLDNPIVVEIGGGYGALAYFIKQAVPHARYHIIDIPTSLMFSGCYLTLAAPRYRVEAMPTAPADFALLPPGSIEGFSPGSIDLAINTLSFMEMPERAVDDYALFLSRALKPSGALFEQNFNNGPLNLPTHCDPEPPLARHLRFERTVPGRHLWGTPNVWRRR